MDTNELAAMEAFLNRVQARALWPGREAVRRGVSNSLAALGGALDGRTRAAVAAHLPAPLREDLAVDPPHPAPRDSDELLDLVARYERVPLGLGLDRALAVLQTVGQAVSPETSVQVRRVAGEDIAQLLEGRVERRSSASDERPAAVVESG